jgi:hypothetical protein
MRRSVSRCAVCTFYPVVHTIVTCVVADITIICARNGALLSVLMEQE